MTIKVKNPKTLRKNNKANILFILYNKGPMSRLQLANELGLTTASITQIINELIQENEVIEIGNKSITRAGRPEILLEINVNQHIAIGVNIENDLTHISVCTLGNVLEENVYKTNEVIVDKNPNILLEKIKETISNWHYDRWPLGIGVGIVGIVENGISINSYGILPNNFGLKVLLEGHLGIPAVVSNNIHAQAKTLLHSPKDNFMLVKHAPGIGCAIVTNGKVLGGELFNAGEIGHTIVERKGIPCRCGKQGCLEAYIAEWHIEDLYYTKSGVKLPVLEIYAKYDRDPIATEILDSCVDYIALAMVNSSMFLDPKKILVTGGIFNSKILFKNILYKCRELGLSEEYSVELVDENINLKALGGATNIIMNKILEV